MFSAVSARSRRPDRRTALFAAMCAGYFLVLLDVTIVNVALPRIATGLNASVAGLQWVVDAYAIALAAGMLTAGALGDQRGHRSIVLAGLAGFGLASLAAGLAPSAGALIAARAGQGAGAALMLPGTLAVIARAYPERDEQRRMIGIWAAVGSAALPAGPLIGGIMVQAVSWRAVFLLGVPVAAGAFLVSTRVLEPAPGDAGRRLDANGMGTGAAALAAVTFMVVQAGRDGLSVPTVAAGVVAGVAAVAFVVAERRSPDPMVPLGLLRHSTFTAAGVVAGLMNLATLGLLFVTTLYLQDGRGRSPVGAGVALLPLFLPLVVVSPLAARASARVGARVTTAAGAATAAAGAALLSLADSDTQMVELAPALMLWGAGLAILTPSVVSAGIGAVPAARSGLAAAVNNTCRQAGGAIGVALFGALAGRPAAPGFVDSFHLTAIIAAGVLLSAATVSLIWIGCD